MGAGGGGGRFPNTDGGKPNNSIHQDRQDKHIVGTKNYNQQIANGKNPSILNENPQQLLGEGSGKGTMLRTTKERVDFGREIGEYYHPPTGQYYNTTNGIIHYDGKGKAHIVPAMPSDFQH